MHKLSFVIPCYNCFETLEKTINSIYEQDIQIPFEIVCVDDFSADKTPFLLERLSEKHNDIFIDFHSDNKGGGITTNDCVKISNGDLIFKLDSDNYLEEHTINFLIELLDSTGCQASSVETIKYFYVNGIETYHWDYVNDNGICDLSHVIKYIKVPPSSGNYLYTRDSYEKAGGYPEHVGAMESWGFGFRQVATGTKIAILKNSCYWHKLTINGYWLREEEKGTNSPNARKTVCEYINLFSPSSQEWLQSSDSEKNFFEELQRGKLELK